jgi:hypothetical protein
MMSIWTFVFWQTYSRNPRCCIILPGTCSIIWTWRVNIKFRVNFSSFHLKSTSQVNLKLHAWRFRSSDTIPADKTEWHQGLLVGRKNLRSRAGCCFYFQFVAFNGLASLTLQCSFSTDTTAILRDTCAPTAIVLLQTVITISTCITWSRTHVMMT